MAELPVKVHVYDLTLLNDYFCPGFMGLYHTGVQIGDTELSFGGNNNPGSGIYSTPPRLNPQYIYRCTIEMGGCQLPGEQVQALVNTLGKKYRGNAYNLFSMNCNHFSEELVRGLVGKPLPKFINRAARWGRHVGCLVRRLTGGASYEESEEEESQIRVEP
jgi:hypothetical protein